MGLLCLFVRMEAQPVNRTIYVALEGADHLSGLAKAVDRNSPDGPVRSIQKAIALARTLRAETMSAAVRIEIAPGRYELPRPLVLTPEDSGLTISSRTGERVEISGGSEIIGWQPSPTNSAVWQVVLPQVREGSWRFNQLFVDGHRAVRARTPNIGFHQADGSLGGGSPIALPFRKGNLIPTWAQKPPGMVVMFVKWTDMHLPLLGVNEATRIASLSGGPLPPWMDEPNVRYWVENVADALDVLGEWFLDQDSGVLSYVAGSSWNPAKSHVIAPRLQELVRLVGDSQSKGHPVASDIHFRGLRFMECDYELPPKGLISQQTAVPIHGAMVIEHASLGSIENCVFENLGGYAIELGIGSRDWSIVGNQIRSEGAGGIRVGDPYHATPSETDACSGHRITDNDISELGRIFAAASGIVVYQSGHNQIRHNHIHDLYYTAISLGWTWGYQASACRDNLVEYNLVEQVGQGMLTDLGGIYTLGPQPGTVIRNNLFRDIVSYDYGGWGLYTDEGSTGIVLENNVVHRCKSSGFHQHYGKDNLLRNNLFAFNHDFQWMRTRAEDHRSFVLNHNVVVFDSGELLGGNWSGGTNSFLTSDNLFWDVRLSSHPSELKFSGQSFSDWQATGQDIHSNIADPLLVDADHPELGLKAGSPAYAMGFRPIDLRSVGVRPPAERVP